MLEGICFFLGYFLSKSCVLGHLLICTNEILYKTESYQFFDAFPIIFLSFFPRVLQKFNEYWFNKYYIVLLIWNNIFLNFFFSLTLLLMFVWAWYTCHLMLIMYIENMLFFLESVQAHNNISHFIMINVRRA